MVKTLLPDSCGKWFLGVERAKMVKVGRSTIHLYKASQLSKEEGEGHGKGRQYNIAYRKNE